MILTIDTDEKLIIVVENVTVRNLMDYLGHNHAFLDYNIESLQPIPSAPPDDDEQYL